MIRDESSSFYLENDKKIDCNGCSACNQVCPVKCISMKVDTDGYLFPKFDSTRCIDCSLCKKSCSNINKQKVETGVEPKAFAAISKNFDILMRSSSGGMFTIISEAMIEKDWVVFGAEIDEQLVVKHTYVKSFSDISKYQKSKYVQSNLKNSFNEARNFLKEGKKVLFTGTPCQISGLKLFLQKEYDNLYCIEIVCHGVPSQETFNKYLKTLEKKHGGKISDFTFRHKTYSKLKGWNSKNIKYKVGEKEYIHHALNDPYLRGFYDSLFLRESCHECKYTNKFRVADITLGDFWGIEILDSTKDVHKGVSALLVNSRKGEEIFDKIKSKVDLIKIDLNFVAQNNSQLEHPSGVPDKRAKFFELIRQDDFDSVINKLSPEKPFYKQILIKYSSPRLKSWLKKIIKK